MFFFRLGYQHRRKYITALSFPSRPVNLTVVTGYAKGRPAEPRSQVAVQTSNNNNEKHLLPYDYSKPKKKDADDLVAKFFQK